MKGTMFLLAAVLWTGVGLTSPRAEQVVLDVDAAVRMARENNLSLQSARIDLGMKERDRNTSWNQFLPSLSGGGALNHVRTAPSASSTDSSPWGLSASLSASLPLSTSNMYGLRAAGLDYQAGVIALEQADKQLERDIRKSFYDLLLKQENIRLLEQSLETARKRYEQVSANYEYGLVSELDKLNAQVNLENLKPNLEKARTGYQSAVMGFKQELGLERTVGLVLEGGIDVQGPSLDVEQLIRTYASRGLDVQALRQELAILENERKLAAAQEFTPALSLSYSYRASLADPFSAAAWSDPGWSGTSSLGISLSMPLDGVIPSSASRVRLAAVDDTVRKTNLELAQVREQGEIKIESLVLNIEQSRLSIEVLQKNAELAARVYELTEQEYEAGLTDLLTLEESYDELQQARLEVLSERYNHQSLLLDLEYELNTPLEG